MKKLHQLFIITFSDASLDCYISESPTTADALWLSRENIGKLLGFEQPAKDVKNIHQKHKSLLDELSTSQNGTVYDDFRGLLKICEASQKENSGNIEQILWGVVDGIWALCRVIDGLSETEAKDFIKNIPATMTFQEFLLLCMKGADEHGE